MLSNAHQDGLELSNGQMDGPGLSKGRAGTKGSKVNGWVAKCGKVPKVLSNGQVVNVLSNGLELQAL